MVIMESGDLLAEMGMFLQVTLAQEKLSDHAQECRQKLISRLEGSHPQAYIDMNGGSRCRIVDNSNCYEEFSNCVKKSKESLIEACENKLYNNLSSISKENIYANNDDTENYININHPSRYEDNTYINPTSPLANTPVIIKPDLPNKNPPSNSNSERNSLISFSKDSPDRTSDTSSFSSSSTRNDESPEVLAMSASALRYAAAKTGMLSRKERFLFMDHTKMYWVAVLNQTMYAFASDTDCKPLFELDIAGYKARSVICTNNKGDFKFELICPGKKTYLFFTDKQLDMDQWISAINSAPKAVDMPKDWSRQLPSPPQEGTNMYDQPDSMTRPLLESGYELPITRGNSPGSQLSISINSHLSDRKSAPEVTPPERYISFNNMIRRNTGQNMPNRFQSSPKEGRRLPAPPQVVYDQPPDKPRPVVEEQTDEYDTLREDVYHCIEDVMDLSQVQKPKEMRRCLPLLPHEEQPQEQGTYDQPDSMVRRIPKPVVPEQEQIYSAIYSNTQEQQLDSQEAVYKNVDDVNGKNKDNEGDYYNLGIDDVNGKNEGDYYNLGVDDVNGKKKNEEGDYLNLEPYLERDNKQECIYEQCHVRDPSPCSQLAFERSRSISSLKKPFVESLNKEIKQRFENKKHTLTTFTTNSASIFNKPFTKSPAKEVKPPVIKKSYR